MVGLRSGILLTLLLGSGWTSAMLSERAERERTAAAEVAVTVAAPVYDRTARLAVGDSFSILYFIPTDTVLRVSGSRVKCVKRGNSQFRVRLYRGTTAGPVVTADSINVACGMPEIVLAPSELWPCWTGALSMRDPARDTVGRPACLIQYAPPVKFDTVTKEWVTVPCVWTYVKDTMMTPTVKGGVISCFPGGVPYDSTNAAARVRRPPLGLNPDTEPYPYTERRPAARVRPPIQLEKP